MGRPSFKNYSKPRPVWMIAVGDTMLYLGQSISVAGIIGNQHTLAICSTVIGTLGFLFTKLYARIEGELIRQEQTTTIVQETKTITDIPKEENTNN